MHSSYGFLRTEPYESDEYEGHKVATPTYDEVDDEEYVQTIVYFIVKVRT
jgi:hypothetical protein